MALVPHHNPGTAYIANDLPRREEVRLEGLNYSRLAAEREATIQAMEAKQANLFNMERLEEQTRRLRQVHLEREAFDREERLHDRFADDRLRALSLEDSKLRTRDQVSREEERRLRMRRSHAELEWSRDAERRRREDEAYRRRLRSLGSRPQAYLPAPRSRHNSSHLLPYRPPTGTPRHLLAPPPPQHHYHQLHQGPMPFPVERSRHYSTGYPSHHPGQHPHHMPPAYAHGRPPVRRRTSSMGAFGEGRPYVHPAPHYAPPHHHHQHTPRYSHAPPPPLPPQRRMRRLSEPDMMRAMVRRPSYRL